MPSKQEKFGDLDTFKNTFTFFFQNIDQGFAMSGKWRDMYFKNNHRILLELGCGKGEYTIGLATKHPENNYVGVDIKGNRIWTGASQALENKLDNVAFLRSRIDFIDHCFGEGEVDEIWITFPDPQPQSTRKRARLTHPIFLDRYRKILKKDGIVHLKTDSTSLYEYTMEVIAENKLPLIWQTNDLYKTCPADRQELINIKTYYEKLFTDKGEDVKYICFKLG